MKKYILILLLLISFGATAQTANRQAGLYSATDTLTKSEYFMSWELTSPYLYKLRPFHNAIIPVEALSAWFYDSLETYGATRYYPLSNPAGYLSSVTWTDISGKPSFATVATTGDYDDLDNKPILFDGDYNSLSNKPTIPTNNNQLTNGAGYITSAPVQSVNGQTGNVNLSFGDSVEFYNSSGKINQKIKVFARTYTPNTGNGYAMDISAAGFSTILSVSVSPVFNTSNAGQIHDFEIKSVSTTSVSVNITTPNAVTVLGVSVLGMPTFIGSGTGTTLNLIVIGY